MALYLHMCEHNESMKRHTAENAYDWNDENGLSE